MMRHLDGVPGPNSKGSIHVTLPSLAPLLSGTQVTFGEGQQCEHWAWYRVGTWLLSMTRTLLPLPVLYPST